MDILNSVKFFKFINVGLLLVGSFGILAYYDLIIVDGLKVNPGIYHTTYNVPGDVQKFVDLWNVPMLFEGVDGSKAYVDSRHNWVASKYPEVMETALGLKGVDITPLLKEQLQHSESVLKYENRYGKI